MEEKAIREKRSKEIQKTKNLGNVKRKMMKKMRWKETKHKCKMVMGKIKSATEGCVIRLSTIDLDTPTNF